MELCLLKLAWNMFMPHVLHQPKSYSEWTIESLRMLRLLEDQALPHLSALRQ